MSGMQDDLRCHCRQLEASTYGRDIDEVVKAAEAAGQQGGFRAAPLLSSSHSSPHCERLPHITVHQVIICKSTRLYHYLPATRHSLQSTEVLCPHKAFV